MSATAKKKAAPKRRATPKISPALRKFLSEWLAWAEAGGPNRRFSNSAGLCVNSPVDVSDELADLLGFESYPFGGESVYYEERDKGAIHKNPLRLAWVRKMLGKAVAKK